MVGRLQSLNPSADTYHKYNGCRRSRQIVKLVQKYDKVYAGIFSYLFKSIPAAHGLLQMHGIFMYILIVYLIIYHQASNGSQTNSDHFVLKWS